MVTKADELDRQVELRQCQSCPNEYPLDNDHFDKDGHGGLRYECHWCRAQYKRGRKDGRAQALMRILRLLAKEERWITR